MITRLKLISEGTEEPIVIGIVAQEPDYKLSLAINRKLGFVLKCGPSVKVEDDIDLSDVTFSRYFYYPHEREMRIDLISNKCENRTLIKKLANIDFLFVVHNPENESFTKMLMDNLKDINLISALFVIPYLNIKDKNSRYLN